MDAALQFVHSADIYRWLITSAQPPKLETNIEKEVRA